MQSIQALLEALKQHEGGPDMEAKPVAVVRKTATFTPLDADDAGIDDDAAADTSQGEEEGDPAQNAEIVSVLQTEYPQIYSKIMAEVGKDDDQDGDSDPLSLDAMASKPMG